MDNIDPTSIAVGIIFPYQQALTQDELTEWLSAQKFSITEASVTQASPGIQISNNLAIAQKGDVEVLFDPAATIDGIGNSTFITFRSQNDASFDAVMEEVGAISSRLGEENLSDEVKAVELNYEGYIRIDRSENKSFSRYFDQKGLDALEETTGKQSQGVAARFEADCQASEPNWYRLLVDSAATGNPNVWAYKLTRRHEEYSDIDEEEINTIINSFVQHS